MSKEPIKPDQFPPENKVDTQFNSAILEDWLLRAIISTVEEYKKGNLTKETFQKYFEVVLLEWSKRNDLAGAKHPASRWTDNDLYKLMDDWYEDINGVDEKAFIKKWIESNK
jgi:hypothetical protein